MLKIEKFVTMSPEQYEIVIEGMRNPKNSWDRMDSGIICAFDEGERWSDPDYIYNIGPNDHALMESLNEGGPVHAKYRRMMPVWVTLTAPLYWWKEFDTYKVGTVSNSCSTMHKIQAKEFKLSDFSLEHMTMESITFGLEPTIDILNKNRELYLAWNAAGEDKKSLWWQMIQLLPTSYNQKRTIFLNYEVLHNIYIWRKNHKLDEWHTFCDWIKELPYSELITMEDDE